MKRMIALALVSSLAGLPALAGCDRTVEEHTKVKENSDGTRSVEKSTVKETPDGGVTKKVERRTDEP